MRVLCWIVGLGCLGLSLAGQGLAGEDLKTQYARLQTKLQQETNPVSKTKTLIKMSEIALREATARVKVGNLEEADKFLIRYGEVVLQATEVLKNSHRNAQKNAAGFRELEISLHHQLRKLNDLKDSYPYDQQETIEKTLLLARSSQQEMLLAIFGPENMRQPKSDTMSRPKKVR